MDALPVGDDKRYLRSQASNYCHSVYTIDEDFTVKEINRTAEQDATRIKCIVQSLLTNYSLVISGPNVTGGKVRQVLYNRRWYL